MRPHKAFWVYQGQWGQQLPTSGLSGLWGLCHHGAAGGSDQHFGPVPRCCSPAVPAPSGFSLSADGFDDVGGVSLAPFLLTSSAPGHVQDDIVTTTSISCWPYGHQQPAAGAGLQVEALHTCAGGLHGAACGSALLFGFLFMPARQEVSSQLALRTLSMLARLIE